MTTVGIPKVPYKVPFIGNLFDLNKSNPWPSFKALAEKHGEIFELNILGKQIVLVAGASLVEELCNEQRFRKQVTKPIEEIRAAVHIALFTAGYEEEKEMRDWSVAHNIIAPKLTPQSVAERFDDFISTTNELFDVWRGFGPSQTIFPITQLDRLNLEATTLALFGKKLNYLDKSHPVLQGMDHSTGEAVQRPNRKPYFLNSLLYGGKFSKAISDMREYAQDLVEHRRNHPTDRNDLLAAMMNSTDSKTGEGLNDTQIIDEIVSMPIGSSTAPCAVATGIYYLLRDPQVVTRAREELDSVVGDDELTYGHLSQLKYVEGIVRESLRLSFAAPGFNIEPLPKGNDTRPVELAGGKYQIPHDQGIIVVLAGANRDASVFEDPLAFKPERMMGEKYENLPLGARRYYGNGKRECIGKHYAWLWQMVVMAKLIKEFDFEAVDPSYELEQEGWFNMRPVDFQAKIKPRKGT